MNPHSPGLHPHAMPHVGAVHVSQADVDRDGLEALAADRGGPDCYRVIVVDEESNQRLVEVIPERVRQVHAGGFRPSWQPSCDRCGVTGHRVLEALCCGLFVTLGCPETGVPPCTAAVTPADPS